MKLHVEYNCSELFEVIKKSNIFQQMDNNDCNHKVIYNTDNPFLIKYMKLVKDKLKSHFCEIDDNYNEIIDDDNVDNVDNKYYAFEAWNTTYKKNKKVQSSTLTWHEDDYNSPVKHPVYTVILYYKRSEGIDNGNLFIKTPQGNQKIDCWGVPTLLIFKGDLTHIPEDVIVKNKNKELKRQVFIMFFKRK